MNTEVVLDKNQVFIAGAPDAAPSAEAELQRLRRSKYIRSVIQHIIAPRTLDNRFDEMRRDNRLLKKENNELKQQWQLERAEVIRLRRQIEAMEDRA